MNSRPAGVPPIVSLRRRNPVHAELALSLRKVDTQPTASKARFQSPAGNCRNILTRTEEAYNKKPGRPG
jgi:hypothetical protein